MTCGSQLVQVPQSLGTSLPLKSVNFSPVQRMVFGICREVWSWKGQGHHTRRVKRFRIKANVHRSASRLIVGWKCVGRSKALTVTWCSKKHTLKAELDIPARAANAGKPLSTIARCANSSASYKARNFKKKLFQ